MVKKKIESLKKNSFAKSIIELKLLSDRIIESRSSSSFTIKYQMLYLIMENGKTSPQQLILDLNMAKSNLALLAKKMIKEGLITQVKDEGNKKQIYYVLLEKGEKELLSKNHH